MKELVKKFYGEGIFTLANVLNDVECEMFIDTAEREGFTLATINMGREGHKINTEWRNNDRVNIQDPEIAELIWKRVQPFIPATMAGRTVQGLDDTFRFYRYEPGQQFDWHVDGATKKPDGSRSLLTFIIYLNDGYEGGDTAFENCSVFGKEGECLIFPHHLRHRGSLVTKDIKYVIRTDVMYGPLNQ